MKRVKRWNSLIWYDVAIAILIIAMIGISIYIVFLIKEQIILQEELELIRENF